MVCPDIRFLSLSILQFKSLDIRVYICQYQASKVCRYQAFHFCQYQSSQISVNLTFLCQYQSSQICQYQSSQISVNIRALKSLSISQLTSSVNIRVLKSVNIKPQFRPSRSLETCHKRPVCSTVI